MKISVVIPTYNREKTIRRAVDSVLNQTQPVDEVIVVDDGSTDHTEEVLSHISDSRVRYIRLQENKGPGGARNEGVRLATGDWVAFHDSDDAWHPDKIEKQLACWEKNQDVRLIYCAYDYKETNQIMPLFYGYDRYDGDIVSLLLPKNMIGAPTMLFEKSLYEEVGGFDETLVALEDWDLAIKMALRTEVGFVPEALMDVYFVGSGVSMNESRISAFPLRNFKPV